MRAAAIAAALLVLTACGSDGATTARPPDGAVTQTVPDVDGDGMEDTAYLAGEGADLRFGIVTADGRDDIAFTSGSPVERRALTVDVDERGPVEVLLSDGRAVQLLAWVDGELAPITDAEGEPYVFDRGFTGNGTGVGCIDADGDGRRDLVGLLRQEHDTKRTIVELDGLHARNGATDVVAGNADTDVEVTCGDLTLADGIGV